MRKRQSGKVALCGVMCDLAMVFMLCGSMFPFATFCAPAMSGILLVPVAMECGMRFAWACYGALALLSLLFVPDKEMAVMFIFLLGHYPLLKAYLQKLPWRWARGAAKALAFNACVFAAYGAMLYLFPIQYVVEEFSQTAAPMLACLVLLGNVCFWVYDAALCNLQRAYLCRIRPLLKRFL